MAALEADRRHSKAPLGPMDGPKMLQGTLVASLTGSLAALRGSCGPPRGLRVPIWGPLRKHEIHEKTLLIIVFSALGRFGE